MFSRRTLLAAPLAAAPAPLQDVFDIHCHSGPDSVPRSIDALSLARLARERGMRGLVLKNHFESTASLAWLARQAAPGLEVFGGVDLNRAVGGINAAAIEYMVRVNGGYGRVVWMPTFDAENEARTAKRGAPFVAVARGGRLLPEVLQALDLIARHQLVLATGHSSFDECLLLIREARSRGIRRIIATHPMLPPIGMTVGQMRQVAAEGAWIEMVCNAVLGAGRVAGLPDLARAMRAVGPERCILASDLGQAANPLHPDGLLAVLKGLRAEGISPAELDAMAKRNPASLFLDQK